MFESCRGRAINILILLQNQILETKERQIFEFCRGIKYDICLPKPKVRGSSPFGTAMQPDAPTPSLIAVVMRQPRPPRRAPRPGRSATPVTENAVPAKARAAAGARPAAASGNDGFRCAGFRSCARSLFVLMA